ncbi:MAG: 6-bladed beta-propeller [Gemmatimonadales bacterium]|nr:6-bladed beta-propeller [Gemmatimonadales bacterium]MBP7620349.1 6-bladed beta-propeller [Gemmatimonadales bacterium]
MEELRIGRGEAEGPTAFGDIRAIAVDPGGEIYVYDGSSQQLRMFDSTGRYLRAIGRVGSGPGEYRDVTALAIHQTGDLLARDPALQQIHRYMPTGTPVTSWRLPSGLYDANSLMTDTAGIVYATILTGPIVPNAPWPMGTTRFDSSGRLLDTFPAPRWLGATSDPGPYDPEVLWTWGASGDQVTAFGANYKVDLRHPNGTVTRIERSGVMPVPVPEAERAELMAVLEARQQEPDEVGGATPPSIPREKPLLRAILSGLDGRVWVRTSLASRSSDVTVDTSLPLARRPRRWTEDFAWDVFESTGRYLGRITLPTRAEPHVMRGDRIWGIVRDADDVPSVVRWKITMK